LAKRRRTGGVIKKTYRIEEKKLSTKDWLSQLQTLDIGEIRLAEPLKNHTTFKIGGPAEVMILHKEPNQLCTIVSFAHKHRLPLRILGGGSNLLISDDGLIGIVLKLGGQMKTVIIDDERIIAESGVPLPFLAAKAAEHGLSGLEFAAGIPGSLGGAVVMNAGAHGQQLSDSIETVTYCDVYGQKQTIAATEAAFCYRDSLFKHDQSLVILSVVLRLKKGNSAAIKEQMLQYKQSRQQKQPLNYPSAGSIFKNPPMQAAAALIEAVGAKGWQIGQAKVSELHSNFIVNLGNASADDVRLLMEKIKNQVHKQFQINLEPEVLFLEDDK